MLVVQVHKVIQEERDMIIVFPHAYHSGFNHGFNIAESTNFAIERWIEYGKRFRGCCCGDKDTTVKVDMVPFIRKFQPDKLERWIEGTDFGLHPGKTYKFLEPSTVDL
jgi:jumonji domain-containing protein 2